MCASGYRLVTRCNRLSNVFTESGILLVTIQSLCRWKNVKMWMLIGAIVIIIGWLISSFVCGFNYDKCKSSPSN